MSKTKPLYRNEEKLRSIDPDREINDLEPFKVTYRSGKVVEVHALDRAESALFAWREDGNAAAGLTALWTLTVARIDIPKDLREWFVANLAMTLNCDGQVSMDKAFGLTDSAGFHNAFTEIKRSAKQSENNYLIHILVSEFSFSESLASRLVHERQSHLGDPDVYPATTMRSHYNRVKGTLENPLAYTETQSDAAARRVHHLCSYDVPALSPADKSTLRRTIANHAVQMTQDGCTAN